MKYNKKFYSHKFKKMGLRYEIATCIMTGCIVWINGPFPCGEYNDLKIFRQGLLQYLDEGERVEADDGYQGEAPKYCKVPGCITRKKDKLALQQKIRCRHEQMNSRYKQFGCLRNNFRHLDLAHHSDCFRAVTVILQLSIDLGVHDISYVAYQD
jgi:hypothetical protein